MITKQPPILIHNINRPKKIMESNKKEDYYYSQIGG
jgi:hypothetical protein